MVTEQEVSAIVSKINSGKIFPIICYPYRTKRVVGKRDELVIIKDWPSNDTYKLFTNRLARLSTENWFTSNHVVYEIVNTTDGLTAYTEVFVGVVDSWLYFGPTITKGFL